MANYGYLQVTRDCNQNCRFCSNPPSGKNDLDIGEAKNIIKKHMEDGCAGIIFTGGEPTIYDGLVELISYCRENNIEAKLISNGQKLADYEYFSSLIDAGLTMIHLSMYSCKDEVQAFLSGNNESLANIKKTLDNTSKFPDLTISINTTICKQNSNHLKENVCWTLDRYPVIKHFVWNNLDPLGNRAVDNPDTIPSLVDFEIELKQAADYLIANNKSFRIERVPLCYLPGYEHLSTETRKIVMKESRNIYFLDDVRGYFKQDVWSYKKGECCEICTLKDICVGLYDGGGSYKLEELYPVFIEKDEVIGKILEN